MCARSHTSGLISAECAASTSASDSGATRASVRRRPRRGAPPPSAWLAVVAAIREPYRGDVTGSGRSARRRGALSGARATPRRPRATDAVRHEIRESSGRTHSSKRPVSSCSSSVTSAWKRRPRLSTSTMSPAPMPFDVARLGAGGSPLGSTSIRVGWGSLTGGARYAASRTERATASHTRRCSATFAARSVRTATIVVRSAASARSSAARNAVEVLGRARGRSRRARRRARSRARAGWRRGARSRRPRG